MTTATKRKETDVMKLMMKDFKVEMPDDEMSEFCVEFHGPDGSLYEGGVWKIRVELPDDYPFKYPLITFENKIYHPNIDEGGGVICLDVIRQAWSPMFDLVNVFEAFLPQLLLYPNPSDPLNKEAGALMLSDPSSYNAKVKAEYCQRYAKPAEIAPPKDSDEDELTEDEKDSGDDQRSIANDMQNLQITEDENDSSDDQSAGTSDPK